MAVKKLPGCAKRKVSLRLLKAVDLPRAADRLERAQSMSGRADLDVLRIALAYAARAQHRPEFIAQFLDKLTASFIDFADTQLLILDRDGRQSDQQVGVPMFRWGFDLIALR